MNHVYTDICVMGAGPAGALLSLLLAKQGHQVVLLERAGNFEREYRGEILQPSTLKLLHDLDMLEKILDLPHKVIDRGGIYDHDKRIMTFTMQELSMEFPYAIQMNQAVLLHAILHEAEKYPNFSLHMKSTITELVQDKQGTVVGGVGVIDKEPVTIHAKVTIGSDGRHSTLRKLVPFDVVRDHHRSDLIWFTVDWPDHLPHELMYMLTGRNNLFMIPKYPDKMQIGYTFSKEQLTRVKENHYQEIRDRVLHYFPELKQQMHSVREFVKLDVVSLTLEHWSTDGFALIGDAAHVMTPIGVIGINVALADAISAAKVLHEALIKGDFSNGILSEVEAIRKPDTDAIQDLQIKVESLIFTTNPVIAVVRPYFIRLLSMTPMARCIMKRFFFPPNEPRTSDSHSTA
jgi:2-polyprenyl-6-methoxyphenol hydroxylase-like FAD-dependent oxidoreductase